jgi:excisionase family DNA binding protein
MDKLLVTPSEAAALLGVGRTRIYDLIARRIIPSVRIGRSLRVPADALQKWVAGQIQGADADVPVRRH